MIRWNKVDVGTGTVEGSDGWSYRLSPPDCDPIDFGQLEPMVALWQRMRGDRPFPRWKDFDFADFIGWHRWIHLMEVSWPDGKFTLRHRIWGSGLADMSRMDPTGQFVTEGIVGFDAEDIRFLQRIVEKQVLGFWTGPFFWMDRGNVRQEIAVAPLSTTGETVDRLISFTHLPGYR